MYDSRFKSNRQAVVDTKIFVANKVFLSLVFRVFAQSIMFIESGAFMSLDLSWVFYPQCFPV